MDVGTLKELCQRLNELAGTLEIMECDPINADLHREASNALRLATSEIERLRSHADQHRETSNALQNALAEIERLRSDATDLNHIAKFDKVLSSFPPSIATDWSMKLLERMHVLIGKKATDRKSGVE